MTVTRVRLFVSHPVARKQYHRLLVNQKDIELVGEDEPYLVGVFDGELASLDALVTLARLKNPSIRPLLLWHSSAENDCLRWMLRGVWGVVSYDHYEEQLSEAVRRLAEGHLWLPASVLMQKLRFDRLSARGPDMSLTGREQEVMDLMLRRLSNKEIATVLRISTRTVKFHVGNVLHKLRVTSRQDLFDNTPLERKLTLSGHPAPDAVPEYS
jgi:DNA-binding NarL/FixJ family response regulator